MHVAGPIFRDLAYVFVAAVAGGFLAWRMRQPLILGYVLAGIVVSPLTPGPRVSDVHTFELFAETGVVLLMFSIGIEFSVAELLRVRNIALIGGPLGIVLSMGLSAGLGALLGWPLSVGLAVGAIISVASTMVLTRLLIDRGELQSEHGKIMVGITLVEDLAVVILTVLLPFFGKLEASVVVDLAKSLAKATLVLVPLLFLAAKVVPPLFRRIARTGNDELFVLVALSLCLGTAAVSQAVGLSLALGAFLAGATISGSDYAHKTLQALLQLRDVFVALFFVTVGLLIDPRALFANMPMLLTLIGLIVVGKFVIWSLVVLLFRYPMRTALLVGLGLTQIGEFSFVLVQVARGAEVVGNDMFYSVLAASLISILINAALVRYGPGWIDALEPKPARA